MYPQWCISVPGVGARPSAHPLDPCLIITRNRSLRLSSSSFLCPRPVVPHTISTTSFRPGTLPAGPASFLQPRHPPRKPGTLPAAPAPSLHTSSAGSLQFRHSAYISRSFPCSPGLLTVPTRGAIFGKMRNRNQTDTNEMATTETKY